MNAIRNSINHLLTYENIHMSKRIIDSIHFENYCNAPIVSMKPRGFWYSLGTEWLEWVRNEEPHWEYKYLYELNIDKSKLIIINNKNDLIAFLNSNYIKSIYDDDYNNYYRTKTYWNLIAKDYCGIEFSNYIKYIDITTPSWYHAIDVSSGCIWNKDCFKCFRRSRTRSKY